MPDRLTYASKLKNLKIPLPPVKDQKIIANFLDDKTAKIDKAITQKEKLIELFKEHKQILIQNVVTKGLNSNVKMKESGLNWIGMIPKTWKLEKGKWLFKKQKRIVCPKDEIVTCFRDGQVTLRRNRRTEGFTNSLKEYGYQGVKRGDLVIHGMDAFAGAIGVSDSDGKSSPVYLVCTPRIKTISQYYYVYFLRYLALNGFIESLSKGIRERSTDFRYSNFSNLLLPVPPLKEQIGIVNFLENKTSEISRAIKLQQVQIEKLKEYKKILINNVVTGKVKVC